MVQYVRESRLEAQTQIFAERHRFCQSCADGHGSRSFDDTDPGVADAARVYCVGAKAFLHVPGAVIAVIERAGMEWFTRCE